MSDYKDPRWIAVRSKSLDMCGDACAICASTSYLQCHHIRYPKGRKIWDVSGSDVVILCKSCHDDITNVVDRVRELTITIMSHPNGVASIKAMMLCLESAEKISHLGKFDELVSLKDVRKADLVDDFIKGFNSISNEDI